MGGGGEEERDDDNIDDDREASTSAAGVDDAGGGGGSATEEEGATMDDPSPAEGGGVKQPKPTAMGNTHLTEERVRLLDDISFVWWALPERVTFEQRLEELRAFREAHGRFPTNKEGALGNWLKGQRKLYTKMDADFMAKRCAKVSVALKHAILCVPSFANLLVHILNLRTCVLLFLVGGSRCCFKAAQVLCVELGRSISAAGAMTFCPLIHAH
jgi:hypothetical protein